MLALVVVAGVPAAQVGYAYLVEALIRPLPEKTQWALRPWLWLAPALAFLAVFLIYPALNTLLLSLKDARSADFVGLQNYVFAFTNRTMLIAFRNNLLWLVFFTFFTVGFGLLMAVLTDRVRYEPLAKSVMFMPMAISFVAASVIWKFVYEFRPEGVAQIGLLNAILTSLIPEFQPVAWLVNQVVNNFALIMVAVWVWVGFCLVILSAALKGIDPALLEAARVDGATEWQVFWRIMIPILSTTIIVVATTMVIFALKAFDVVYVMTNGNFNTEVIANRMYKEMFNFRRTFATITGIVARRLSGERPAPPAPARSPARGRRRHLPAVVHPDRRPAGELVPAAPGGHPDRLVDGPGPAHAVHAGELPAGAGRL